MGALQMGQSFLFWIHSKRHLQWKRWPQVLRRRQLRSSVMQMTQFWSGAVVQGVKMRLKLSSSCAQLLYLRTEAHSEHSERQQALTTESTHMQSSSPSRCMNAFRNSRTRLQQCHTRSEFPTIPSASSSRQQDGSSLMFWLKQLSSSRWVAMLDSSRNTESTASMSVGKRSRLVKRSVSPPKSSWTATRQARLQPKRTSPKSLEAERMAAILRLQEQSCRSRSRSMRTTQMARRTSPTPTYDPTHTARSIMFQSTSARISTTIDRWQKQAYSSVFGLCCGRASAIWKYTASTRCNSARRITRPTASSSTPFSVIGGSLSWREAAKLLVRPHMIISQYKQQIDRRHTVQQLCSKNIFS